MNLLQFIGIGGPSAPTRGAAQAADRIALFQISEQGIFENAAPLYESGKSLREISKVLAIPKTMIRQTLLRRGVTLRPPTRVRRVYSPSPKRVHVGGHPYGFYLLDGKLIPDEREQRNIQLILKLRDEGKSISAIVAYLNRHGTRPRKARAWYDTIVRFIVQRHKAK